MHINNGFTASFMAFYAFVPFYNKLISVLSKKDLMILVLGMLFVMTGCSSFFFAGTMNEPVWYMTLYFVSAYIRLYPNKWTDSLKLSTLILFSSTIIAIAICLGCVFVSNFLESSAFVGYKWYFVSDSNKILAFIIGLSAFLTGKNCHMGHSRIINMLAAGCFGVLLIHASSDTMRRWLWQDVCNVPGMLRADLSSLVAQAVAVPVIIFLICSFIDHYYKKFIEPFLMGLIFKDRKQSMITSSSFLKE